MRSKHKRAKNLSKEAKKLIDKYKYYGIKTIEKKLKQRNLCHYRKSIKDYLKNEHNLIKQTTNMVDRHIVANYLGDWCYVIIINSGIKDNEGHRYKGYRKKFFRANFFFKN